MNLSKTEGKGSMSSFIKAGKMDGCMQQRPGKRDQAYEEHKPEKPRSGKRFIKPLQYQSSLQPAHPAVLVSVLILGAI